jgi:AcrR family transcriptional regulator
VTSSTAPADPVGIEPNPTAEDHAAALAARRADPRYQRLLTAVRHAAQDGYDGVSMRKVATASRLSLATIYEFCPSKNQLIAEAHADRMERFRTRLAQTPPDGATAEARVLAVVHGMVDTLERDEVVTRTLMRALYSGDRGVAISRDAVTITYRAIIDGAIGDDSLDDRDAVIETLGFVLNAVILDWLMPGLTSDDSDAAHARGVLERAVHVLFRPAAR